MIATLPSSHGKVMPKKIDRNNPHVAIKQGDIEKTSLRVGRAVAHGLIGRFPLPFFWRDYIVLPVNHEFSNQPHCSFENREMTHSLIHCETSRSFFIRSLPFTQALKLATVIEPRAQPSFRGVLGQRCL